MDNIVPFILETLSSKPQLEETETNLMKELRRKFKNQNLNSSNLKKNFEEAVEIGQELGIFRLAGENISLPFSLENNQKQSEPKLTNKSTTDKVHRPSRRRSSTSRRRQSHSRSRSGGRSRSSRRRRSSRR